MQLMASQYFFECVSRAVFYSGTGLHDSIEGDSKNRIFKALNECNVPFFLPAV